MRIGCNRVACKTGNDHFGFWIDINGLTVHATGCENLVFIMCMGYYITPALLGGPKEQMLSYFIAFYTNQTINWGMAAALSAVLLAATLLLYMVYARYLGPTRVKYMKAR